MCVFVTQVCTILLCFFSSTPHPGTFKHFLKEITISTGAISGGIGVGLGRITDEGQESYLAILPQILPYQIVEITGLRDVKQRLCA